jgi:hypothetical protein
MNLYRKMIDTHDALKLLTLSIITIDATSIYKLIEALKKEDLGINDLPGNFTDLCKWEVLDDFLNKTNYIKYIKTIKATKKKLRKEINTFIKSDSPIRMLASYKFDFENDKPYIYFRLFHDMHAESSELVIKNRSDILAGLTDFF